MTERKPPGVSFETWVERQIAQAQERGDLAAPAGAGRPLLDLDREETAYDWALAKARREGVDTGAMLPPGLRLRRERDDLPERAARLATEAEVRALAEDYNARVEAFWRQPAESRWAAVPGLADVEALVAGWAATRPEPAVPAETVAEPEPAARRWWRRRR
ncbi:DnaJ family domain-containing protein [Blastococcus sp. SYSU D01042]